VLHETRSALVRLSPFEWGEALLRPSSAAMVASSLHARLRAGDHRAIEDVLDSGLEEEHPAQVAALEAVFVATGLVLLEGAEVPTDQLESLWDEQLRACIELPGELPAQRIEHLAPEEPLLARGTWCLAALSIAEQLPSARGLRHSLLRPWSAPTPPVGLSGLYDRVAQALLMAQDRTWAVPAWSLIDRLRSAIGSVEHSEGKPHVLELPGLFLDEVEHGVPAHETWRALSEHELGARALGSVAAARGVPWARVAEAVFTAWEGCGYPEHANAALFGEAASRELWPHAPASVLRAWLPTASSTQRAHVYACLTAPQWASLAESLHAAPFADESALWALAPTTQVADWLAEADRTLAPEVIAALWCRDATLAVGAVQRAVASRGFDQLLALVERAPRAALGQLLPALRAALDPGATPVSALDPLRRWLHARVAERGPEWHDAYALLVACERALLPLRAQRVG
jgi:hypothetical protein